MAASCRNPPASERQPGVRRPSQGVDFADAQQGRARDRPRWTSGPNLTPCNWTSYMRSKPVPPVSIAVCWLSSRITRIGRLGNKAAGWCASGPNRAMRFFAATLVVTTTTATPPSSSVIYFTVGGRSNRVATPIRRKLRVGGRVPQPPVPFCSAGLTGLSRLPLERPSAGLDNPPGCNVPLHQKEVCSWVNHYDPGAPSTDSPHNASPMASAAAARCGSRMWP